MFRNKLSTTAKEKTAKYKRIGIFVGGGGIAAGGVASATGAVVVTPPMLPFAIVGGVCGAGALAMKLSAARRLEASSY